MRSYERSGITIDQCTGCRGVFLDRGELERLVDMEGNFYAGAAGQGGGRGYQEPRPPRPPERYERDDDDEHRRAYGYGGHGGHRKHKREGFLGELFDF